MHNTTKEKYAHYRVKQVRNKSVLTTSTFFLVILLVVAIDAQGISQRPFDGKSPTRTQADGHTDFSWVVPKSVQVRGDRTYANSDVNHKINKTIGSVCGYRSESSRKICPFRFRLMHQIGR